MPTILHLIDTSGPGGAEIVFLDLFNAFDRDLAADPDRRGRLGAAARDTVERRFSLDAMIRAYRDLYEEVLHV